MSERRTPWVLVLGTADWNQPIATNQHYVVREISRIFDVTFVESLGLRRPEISRRDIRRVVNRFKSNTETTCTRAVPSGVTVLSPKVVPLHTGPWTSLNNLILRKLLRNWIGSDSPKVFWTYSPVTYGLGSSASVRIYHCVDLYGTFPGINSNLIDRSERRLASEGFIAIGSSQVVVEHLEKQGFKNVIFWPNVADTAEIRRVAAAVDVKRQSRALFAGNLSDRKVDFRILESLLSHGIELHIAGPIGEGGGASAAAVDRLRALGAHYHGVLDMQSMASLMLKCRVGLIPYQLNSYTRGISPLKTYEYLSAGMSVVSTALPSMETIEQHIFVEHSEQAFVKRVLDEVQLDATTSLDSARVALADDHSWVGRGSEARRLVVEHSELSKGTQMKEENQGMISPLDSERSVQALPFDHFILTRFNVRLSEDSARPSDVWLEERLRRFQDFCLLSFAGQTVKSFAWLVFVDASSPSWFKDRLAEIQKNSGDIFEAVWIDEAFSGDVAARETNCRAKSRRVLTTRVDNDDAVARDFVEAIQAEVGNKFEFLNPVDGSQFAASGLYRRPYPSNPFISLFEPLALNDKARTVFVGEHPVLGRYGPMRDFRVGHALWMQVVHGGNIANEVVGFRSSAKAYRAWFDIQLPDDPSRLRMRASQLSSAVRIGARLAVKPSRIVALISSSDAKRLSKPEERNATDEAIAND